MQEFLSVAGALSDKELTGDLRRGRVDALRAGAAFEAQKEQEAETRARNIDGVMTSLAAILTANGIKLDGEAAKVRIDVVDQTGGRAKVTGDAY